jgi:dGTPase
MEGYGERFDHNLHALRVVEQFEQKYADFPGLNLTFEVREGIVKHSRDYDPEQHPDLKEYRLGERPPLEAQIIDVADEIAYNCADLDDGCEAKLLTLRQIRENVPLFDHFYCPVERKYAAAATKLKFNETLKRLMDALVTDLIATTEKRLGELHVRTIQDVRSAPERLVSLNPNLLLENRRLKQFLHANLYNHREIYAERKKIVTYVMELFEFFMDHPRCLPPFYIAKMQEEPPQRVLCDYIAGMTDNYLAEQHHKHLRR